MASEGDSIREGRHWIDRVLIVALLPILFLLVGLAINWFDHDAVPKTFLNSLFKYGVLSWIFIWGLALLIRPDVALKWGRGGRRVNTATLFYAVYGRLLGIVLVAVSSFCLLGVLGLLGHSFISAKP
jgi:hypothetical protein